MQLAARQHTAEHDDGREDDPHHHTHELRLSIATWELPACMAGRRVVGAEHGHEAHDAADPGQQTCQSEEKAVQGGIPRPHRSASQRTRERQRQRLSEKGSQSSSCVRETVEHI